MPLRSLIQTAPERLSDFLMAADDRFEDAETLLVERRFDAAVYMFGYAAEMWLKAACLRLRGLGPTSPVKPGLAALRYWMKVTVPVVAFTDYHDLSFFAQSILSLRSSLGRPLPLPLAVDLQSRVINGLYPEWIVDMRYRRTNLAAADAWAALNNTWWVKMNWLSLT
jgi:hypothetical protein